MCEDSRSSLSVAVHLHINPLFIINTENSPERDRKKCLNSANPHMFDLEGGESPVPDEGMRV